MNIDELNNKNILLVGFGKEGKATEKFLQEKYPSSSIAIADKTQGDNYLDHQQEFDLAIVSPGIPSRKITIPFTTATNIFFSQVKGMTIGVTGTKGKSTTTSLIYEILKQAGMQAHLVGNIGNPMLSELLMSNTTEDVWVCELSSYQLETIEYSPYIGVIVSLFPEHMNYHGSVTAYFEAKSHITKYQTDKGYFVYNPNFPEIVQMAEHTKAQAKPFVEVLPFDESIIPLLGEHNKSNIKGAVTVGEILGISKNDIEEAVKNFQSLRHRLQNVGTFAGITFYDDAISTTPQSTVAALAALPNVGTLMLGGLDRGYDFGKLAEKLQEYTIPNLVIFPESGKTILRELEKHSEYRPRVLETSSMEEAVDFAYQNTPQGMICLLSTASPSYTIWKNFEEKGDEFQKWVKTLGKSE
jgi:UDP-N-acetylmuramoylalanine--D-glutamate ligase